MGMTEVFKWLRKDTTQRHRRRQSLSPKLNRFNDESYRTALHAFMERRKDPNDPGYILSFDSPDVSHLDFFTKKTTSNESNHDQKNQNKSITSILEVPNAQTSEIFEIHWVAGTENRCINLIHAEWQNTKVCLRRHTHPDCKNAVRADLDILREIRHPNVLLLMGTSHSNHYGLVAIYEPIDCTLFNYIHDQEERVAVQDIVKCIRNLAAALKHAHMLGYIHSAISSHCVFFDLNGIVKLGGWELAINTSQPKQPRSYEKLLRNEIFQWQAPELFLGQTASTATDVYGLSLLMWEMCTMNIPWANLNYTEIEIQYVQQKQSVITDIYDFPPILDTLLEAGLQLDVTKRILNMTKMSRLLQKLEMQYEDVNPIYIVQPINNNDYQTSIKTSQNNISSYYNDFTIPDYLTTDVITRRYSKKLTSHANHRKTEEMVKSSNSHYVSSDKQKSHMKIVGEFLQNQSDKNIKVSKAIKETKINNNICDSDHKTNKMDDNIELTNDSRISIQRLKETLANKREHFFYGDNSSFDASLSVHDSSKTCILSQVRSKDYEPHKPASHKTSLEPKQTILSTPQLSASITKSLYNKKQRAPYSHVPKPIKNAVIQPQVLNPNSQTFFETSLWQKEKSICLSKVKPENSQNNSFHSQYHSENIEIPENNLPTNDETFTVNVNLSVKNSKPNEEHFTPINESVGNITASSILKSKSLQALKDALKRATDIVKTNTSITSTTTDTLPYESSEKFKGIIDKSNKIELAHTDLYKFDNTTHNKVKFIEDKFKVAMIHSDGCKNEQENLHFVNHELSRDALTNASASRSSSTSATQKKFKCAEFVESLNKHDIYKMMEKENVKFMYLTRDEAANSVSQNNMDHEISDACFASFDLDDAKTKKIGYSSCLKNYSIRRRSLPLELGQLSPNNNTSLKKLPVKNSDFPDATVEDLYIDDEFDEVSLAPNMILMN